MAVIWDCLTWWWCYIWNLDLFWYFWSWSALVNVGLTDHCNLTTSTEASSGQKWLGAGLIDQYNGPGDNQCGLGRWVVLTLPSGWDSQEGVGGGR